MLRTARLIRQWIKRMQNIRLSCSLREASRESPRFIFGQSDFHPCLLGVSKEVFKNKSYFKDMMIFIIQNSVEYVIMQEKPVIRGYRLLVGSTKASE